MKHTKSIMALLVISCQINTQLSIQQPIQYGKTLVSYVRSKSYDILIDPYIIPIFLTGSGSLYFFSTIKCKNLYEQSIAFPTALTLYLYAHWVVRKKLVDGKWSFIPQWNRNYFFLKTV